VEHDHVGHQSANLSIAAATRSPIPDRGEQISGVAIMGPMTLRGEAVTLRPWSEDDIPAILSLIEDPDILHWIPVIPRPYTADDARAFVNDEIGLGPHQFAIDVDGRLVGSIGMRVNEHATGHVGYWCARAERGRGIVPDALRTISRYGFDELGLRRMELITDPDNRASQRVAEKTGYQREGVLRSHLVHPDGRRRDSVMFSLLPGELR
jgi:RimJ/RimL family protein N-acetyltransferase